MLSREETKFATILLGKADKALDLFLLCADLLTERLDDCISNIQILAGVCGLRSQQKQIADRQGSLWECNEIACPRIELNRFCPSAWRAILTMGVKMPSGATLPMRMVHRMVRRPARRSPELSVGHTNRASGCYRRELQVFLQVVLGETRTLCLWFAQPESCWI